MSLFDFIGLGGSGARNTFRAQSADITNPAGTSANAQQQIAGAQGTSAGLLGQQGALAGQFQQQMGQRDPRLDALAQMMATGQRDPRTDALIGQLSQQAAGQGPNPAQQQFQQNINQAVQQQAGGVASMRGTNPALAARMAAQGGAGMMQGAAGQAATLQAQQQLSAQSLAGQLMGQQGQLALGAQQGAAGIMSGQGQLQAQYGSLGAGLLGGMGQQGLTQQQILQASLANQNAQRVAMQQNMNSVNAGVAAQNAQTSAGLIGGLLGGGGSALGMMGLTGGGGAGAGAGAGALAAGAAKGGRVVRGGVTRAPKMAGGGMMDLGTFDQTMGMPWAAPTFEAPGTQAAPAPMAAAAQPAKSPQSDLGKQMQQGMQDVADRGMGAFRSFAPSAQGYAPYVMSPQQFAEGGEAGAPPSAPGAAPATPNISAQAAGIARTVAESLSRLDPKAAAVVYADLTGLPHNFTPDETRSAYHMLALHNAALLAQPNGANQPPVPMGPAPRRASRRPVTTPEGQDTLPLKRAMGGATFARDGKVPGHAEVDGDSEQNDKVPAMLSPGEIVIPRTVAQAPDAPRKAAGFVAHLVAKKNQGFNRVRRS